MVKFFKIINKKTFKYYSDIIKETNHNKNPRLYKIFQTKER